MSPSLRRLGDRAWLVEYPDLAATTAGLGALTRTRPEGIEELVPAARTVLVRFDPDVVSAADVAVWVSATPATATEAVADRTVVEIPVNYDGPDLLSVADLLGVSPGELIRRHLRTAWQCAFVGFAPGFAYLSSPDPFWQVPRRTTSRPEVPAGSVGLADTFSGIYPRRSPGGWQLIGRTDITLWDPAVDPPALLPPGTFVRFVEARWR